MHTFHLNNQVAYDLMICINNVVNDQPAERGGCDFLSERQILFGWYEADAVPDRGETAARSMC